MLIGIWGCSFLLSPWSSPHFLLLLIPPTVLVWFHSTIGVELGAAMPLYELAMWAWFHSTGMEFGIAMPL